MLTEKEKKYYSARNAGPISDKSWDEIIKAINELKVGDLIWVDSWESPIAKFLGTHVGSTWGGETTYVDLEFENGKTTSAYQYSVYRKLTKEEIEIKVKELNSKLKFYL